MKANNHSRLWITLFGKFLLIIMCLHLESTAASQCLSLPNSHTLCHLVQHWLFLQQVFCPVIGVSIREIVHLTLMLWQLLPHYRLPSKQWSPPTNGTHDVTHRTGQDVGVANGLEDEGEGDDSSYHEHMSMEGSSDSEASVSEDNNDQIQGEFIPLLLVLLLKYVLGNL